MPNDPIDWTEFQTPSEYADVFKFVEPGDRIVGEIIEIRVAQTEHGRSPVMTIKPDDGDERTVWISNVDLQNKMAAARPQKGDRVAIVFRERGEAKPGQSPPKLYDVDLKRGDDPAATSIPSPQPAGAPKASDLL